MKTHININKVKRLRARRVLVLLPLSLFTLLPFTSCTDRFDDEEGKTPTWLGTNIYDYLKSRGDCNTFVRLIDDDGLTDVMRLTGSNTVFFCNDNAFNRFYQSNTMGIKSYDQIPASMKTMFLRFGVISNAQLIERLSKSDRGNLLLRRTTNMGVTDTIPLVSASSLPGNSYFAKLRAAGKPVRLLQDGTQFTFVQFFPEVMTGKGFTDDDFRFITGNDSVSIRDPYVYGNRLINQDLICKNGYLHELQDVLLPPENMAGYIRQNSDLSTFNHLLDRFAIPTYYGKTETGDSIYELRYFNTGGRALTTDNEKNTAPGTLLFDPGWNLYGAATGAGYNQPAYEQSMAAMFVPTNEAMAEFFSPTGEGADFCNAFGSWDNVPTTMIADIINSHMKNNFLQALPSKFSRMEDENGYSVNVDKSNIVSTFIGRNGLVYVTNKVFVPQDYKTVMGPAKINLSNSIFARAITNDTYSYYSYILRAPKNTFYFFVTPDAYMKDYVDPVAEAYTSSANHCKLNFYTNASNNIVAMPVSADGDTIRSTTFPLGTNGTVSSTATIKNRLNDILGTQTIVMSYIGELEERLAQGQQYFVTNSYAPVHITSLATGSHVKGSGNKEGVKILKSFDKSNGRTYEVDGIVQNTTTSIYDVLKSHQEFTDFFDICNAIGVFSTKAADGSAAKDYMVSFLNRYHYTIYVPTNSAIEAAQKKGIIPTVSDWENDGDAEKKAAMQKKLLRFVRYHFQDNSVFIHGAKETGADYLSGTLNEQMATFYPINVTNTGDAITLKDSKGAMAHVVTKGGLYNLLARDIVLNSPDRNKATEMSSYAFAVIHQIDNVLTFE